MARRRAVQALYRWELDGNLCDASEANFLDEWGLCGVDQNYFRELIQAIPKTTTELDDILEQCLDRDILSVDPVERAILHLATYELRFRLEIPAKVILDEAVELARIFGADQGYRFVNGVLDRCQGLCRDLPSSAT